MKLWRNILSSEALASPFHKLGIFELEIEQIIYIESINNINNKLYSNISNLSNIDLTNENKNKNENEKLNKLNKKKIKNKLKDLNNKFINIMPCYEIHAILDELYYSINDLMSHPIVIEPSFEQRKLIASMIASNKNSNKSLYNIDDLVFLNENLCQILTNWHYPLFDALSSVHHQIVASSLRILSVSTRWYTRKLLNNNKKNENTQSNINNEKKNK